MNVISQPCEYGPRKGILGRTFYCTRFGGLMDVPLNYFLFFFFVFYSKGLDTKVIPLETFHYLNLFLAIGYFFLLMAQVIQSHTFCST